MKKYEKRLKQLADPKYIDVDCWSLDHSTATFLAPRLRYLAKNCPGHPVSISYKKWKKKLNKMATAFELVLEDDYFDECINQKKIEKGLKLFVKWFQHLWT